MRKLASVVLTLGLGLVAGCPDKETAEGYPSTPLTASELCAMVVVRDANDAMCTQQSLFDGAGYDAQIERMCRPGTDERKWAEKLLLAVDEGRVQITWPKAHECIDKAHRLRADNPAWKLIDGAEWQALQDGVCKTFFNGGKAAGESCKEDWDCPSGMGCYSATPDQAGSAKCMAPVAGAALDCDPEFLPCAEGLRCDGETMKCVAPGQLGAPCDYDEDCASGTCDSDTYQCAAPKKAIGQPCTEPEECAGECIGCLPKVAGASPTCERLGGSGAYCRDWWDCVDDLGCTSGVCGTVGQGVRCGPEDQTVCASDLSCMPPVDCGALDSGACAAEDTCAWDDYYGECSAVAGFCEKLPTSGACHASGYCAGGYFCDPAKNTCEPAGGNGAGCNDTVEGMCDESLGYVCWQGTCQRFCEVNEDCGANEFCDDSDESAPPVCSPINLSACPGSFACPQGQYCDLPGAQCFMHVDSSYDIDPAACAADPECVFSNDGTCESSDTCATKTIEANCTADALCQWQALTSPTCAKVPCQGNTQANCDTMAGCFYGTVEGQAGCYSECWTPERDADQTACDATPGCAYVTEYSWCDAACGTLDSAGACGDAATCVWNAFECAPKYDCSQHDDDRTACDAAATCAWDGTPACDAVDPYALGQCAPRLDVGEAAVPDNGDLTIPSDDSEMCVYEYAVQTAPGEFVCSVKPTNIVNGCTAVNDTTQALIQLTFLFGGVLFVRRRLRARN